MSTTKSSAHPTPPSLTAIHRIEQEALADGREWTRRQLQARLQAEADRLGPFSPQSGRKLKRARQIRMVVRTVCGLVTLQVWYGYCQECRQWLCPVRINWQMAAHQQLSPELEQRLCYTAVETDSFEKAARMAQVWGCSISDNAIYACVARKGQQAEAQPLTELRPTHARGADTLIIMMDGWLARHRDTAWGMKPADKPANRVCWNEIKSAIIFRLADRGESAGKRRFLVHKQVTATPADTDVLTFAQQVQREAMRMGLAKANQVYVIQDGAVYLWNIFRDRFAQNAQGVLDFYHASDHLWALANELFGEGSLEAKRWVQPLLHRLRHGKEKRVIKTLIELCHATPPEHIHAIEKIVATTAYFCDHVDHIHYADYARQGVPIGSGAMESQCSQFQSRFKRRGQFWSSQGLAHLLAVSIRTQNNELFSFWAA